MKYISLFSGIGGFELGFERVMGDRAECIGFSEVDPYALKVYQTHFPDHLNLGDITKITEEQIQELLQRTGGCDMIVGGFPCTNLTSIARLTGNSDGLDGPASSLFWTMLNLIQWVKKHNPNNTLHIIVENNASMTKKNREKITIELQKCFDVKIYNTLLNGCDFGVQIRKRIFWTTFELDKTAIQCTQTWDDVLLPFDEVSSYSLCSIPYMNKILNKTGNQSVIAVKHGRKNWFRYEKSSVQYISRWNLSEHSDTITNAKKIPIYYPVGKSRPIRRNGNRLVDRRCHPSEKYFIYRSFSPVEVARLFWFPDDWCSEFSKSQQIKLYGNTVVVAVIEFIVKEFLKFHQPVQG